MTKESFLLLGFDLSDTNFDKETWLIEDCIERDIEEDIKTDKEKYDLTREESIEDMFFTKIQEKGFLYIEEGTSNSIDKTPVGINILPLIENSGSLLYGEVLDKVVELRKILKLKWEVPWGIYWGEYKE